ncbi:FidL-like putative membrane protein [Serratia fonticola]|uniref:FidL-like putative membrane protein n=1 Tax=Serratia fonticola TaxID=47917 RepID=A0A542BUL7_SERFO|nr:hypothetical protein [Serratia fonticola]TQI82270.1 FidL-like putative membrane protein [Serratia fonticola]TQI95710.1 FidL-like putative membrane protein [Serratia fonticola]TVZ70206.1 FidL-like putative membrane protein [Serratia fonticola]
MKKLAIISLFLISLGSILFYIYQSPQRKPFHCDAEMIAHISDPGVERVDLNAHIDIMYTSENYGFIKFSGSVKHGENHYSLSRNTYFTITPSDLENVNKIAFTHEDIHPRDNTPEDLWKNRILPQIPGIEFYSKVRVVNKNAIIIKGFSNPLLVCIRH